MRILCADNSEVSRIGISKVLNQSGFAVGKEVDNYASLRKELEQTEHDLLISELRFEDAEFLDIVDEVRTARPSMMILIYTFHINPTYVARAAAHKLYDFVLKSSEVDRLVRSVASAHNGAAPQESLLLKASKFLKQSPKTGVSSADTLTKRELQILSHLSLGLSNREISSILDISLETVKEHVQNILRKLKSSDRTEAAVWALRNGIPTLTLDE